MHPQNNNYGPNPQDPNEWGFRVPLIVISPWIKKRGYISTAVRSQGAILNFIEDAFGLPPHLLGGDDAANFPDDLGDMFDSTQPTPALPYIPVPGPLFSPNPGSGCPHGSH